MNWFNYIGLIIVALIMIPNIIYAIKKPAPDNSSISKTLIIFENIGRYGSMLFMAFNIPYTYLGFYVQNGLLIYVIINSILLVSYIVLFIILWNKFGIVKGLLLSIIPSLIFIFSGIFILSIPLIIVSIIFSICHIIISAKNSLKEEDNRNTKKRVIITLSSVLAFILLIVISITVGGIVASLSKLKKLENMTSQEMINYDIKDGSVIGIAKYDGSVSNGVFTATGFKDEDYEFEIGSLSKTFLALLFAKLVNEGKVKYTDSISKYLDLDDSKYYPTIERLLRHMSGYKEYYLESEIVLNRLSKNTSNDYYGVSKEKILNRIKSIKLKDKTYPFRYSNFGYAVLGLVIESIYNDSYANVLSSFIKSEIPFMSNTTVAFPFGNMSEITPYWKWKQDDGYIPAGAIKSTTHDMLYYLLAYRNSQMSYKALTYSKLISIDANNKTNLALNIRMDFMGLGWIYDSENKWLWHNGGTSNYNSYMAFSADFKYGIVLMSNISPNEKIPMTVIGTKMMSEMRDYLNKMYGGL